MSKEEMEDLNDLEVMVTSAEHWLRAARRAVEEKAAFRARVHLGRARDYLINTMRQETNEVGG